MLRRWKAAIDREELIAHFATLHMEHQSAEQAVRKSWQKKRRKVPTRARIDWTHYHGLCFKLGNAEDVES